MAGVGGVEEVAAAREVGLQRAAVVLRDGFGVGDDEQADAARDVARAVLVLVAEAGFGVLDAFVSGAPIAAAVLPPGAFAVALQVQDLAVRGFAEVQERAGEALRAGDVDAFAVAAVCQVELAFAGDVALLYAQRVAVGVDEFEVQARLQLFVRRDEVGKAPALARVVAHVGFEGDVAFEVADGLFLCFAELQERLVAQDEGAVVMQAPPGAGEEGGGDERQQGGVI